jgi:hypothetical protein
LVDGGRYRYTPDDPYVAYLRATAGHNTLVIDGFGQGPDARIAEQPLSGAFASSAGLDAARGVYDAGYPGLTGEARHERTVVYVRNGYWIVLDRIVSDRPRNITAHWRFHPDVNVRVDGVEAFSDDPGTGNLRITPVADAPLSLSVVRGREAPEPMGWYSPDYNERRAASVAVYETSLGAQGVLAFVLTPSLGSPAPPRVTRLDAPAGIIRLRIERSGEAGATLSIRLQSDGQSPDILFERDGAEPVALRFAA